MNCPHCNTPIDEHEANRCLSGWVHVDVMGRKLPDHDWETDTYCDCVPDYSTDMAAAWIIWNHCISQLFSERDCFFTVLEDDLTERSYEHERGWRIAWPHAMMNLSPLTICRAALKAVAVIQERKVTA